jgi:two-component system NtrC family sensor kinase
LGLSIVYGIIDKHHGHISVESKEGEGTRFTIRMPYNPQAVVAERASA